MNYNSRKGKIRQYKTDEFVFVFYLEGGMYSISMSHIGGGLTKVLATSGNVVLGGSSFDYHIAQYLNKLVQEQNLSTLEGKKVFWQFPK